MCAVSAPVDEGSTFTLTPHLSQSTERLILSLTLLPRVLCTMSHLMSVAHLRHSWWQREEEEEEESTQWLCTLIYLIWCISDHSSWTINCAQDVLWALYLNYLGAHLFHAAISISSVQWSLEGCREEWERRCLTSPIALCMGKREKEKRRKKYYFDTRGIVAQLYQLVQGCS